MAAWTPGRRDSSLGAWLPAGGGSEKGVKRSWPGAAAPPQSAAGVGPGMAPHACYMAVNLWNMGVPRGTRRQDGARRSQQGHSRHCWQRARGQRRTRLRPAPPLPRPADMMKASEVMALGCGFSIPKTTLFVALLRAVGIPARMHMVRGRAYAVGRACAGSACHSRAPPHRG
jgi:hypothetical protein